ncbi:MAG TPA: hypothetical protein VGU68_03225, partial [Ktedonobacteraceae bacterium]|nr:hypothetical protein [Ktedonobacteraceae bacterium]
VLNALKKPEYSYSLLDDSLSGSRRFLHKIEEILALLVCICLGANAHSPERPRGQLLLPSSESKH